MIYFSTLTVVAKNVLHFKAYYSQIQLVFLWEPPSLPYIPIFDAYNTGN